MMSFFVKNNLLLMVVSPKRTLGKPREVKKQIKTRITKKLNNKQ